MLHLLGASVWHLAYSYVYTIEIPRGPSPPTSVDTYVGDRHGIQDVILTHHLLCHNISL